MEIFVTKIADLERPSDEVLKRFMKREISNPNRMFVHCLAYFWLDKILQEKYNIQNREIIFDNGKPKLVNLLKHFSISHSGNYLVIAISDYDCGIDIEENKARKFDKIAKRMNFTCANISEFYRAWTKFEAEYKLGVLAKSLQTENIENYTLTAVSENPNETFVFV